MEEKRSLMNSIMENFNAAANDFQMLACKNENIFREEINNLQAQLNEKIRLLNEVTDKLEELKIQHENMKLDFQARAAEQHCSQKTDYNKGNRILVLKAAYQSAQYRQKEFEHRQNEREKGLEEYIEECKKEYEEHIKQYDNCLIQYVEREREYEECLKEYNQREREYEECLKEYNQREREYEYHMMENDQCLRECNNFSYGLLHYAKNLEEVVYNRSNLVDRGSCSETCDCNDCKSSEQSMSQQNSDVLIMLHSEKKMKVILSESSCQTEEFLGEMGLYPITIKISVINEASDKIIMLEQNCEIKGIKTIKEGTAFDLLEKSLALNALQINSDDKIINSKESNQIDEKAQASLSGSSSHSGRAKFLIKKNKRLARAFKKTRVNFKKIVSIGIY